jgi:hypothetical protein
MSTTWYLTQYPLTGPNRSIVGKFPLPLLEDRLEPLYALFGYQADDPAMILSRSVDHKLKDAVERLSGERLDFRRFVYFIECMQD